MPCNNTSNGLASNPTWSADDPEVNGLDERLMQLVGKSWETAVVEGKDHFAHSTQPSEPTEILSTQLPAENQQNGSSVARFGQDYQTNRYKPSMKTRKAGTQKRK